MDGALHAYDATGGSRLWTGAALGTSYRLQGMAAADLLVVTLPSDRLSHGTYRLTGHDRATGRQRWSLDARDLSAPPTGSHVYALTPDLALTAVGGQDGSTVWTRPTGLSAAAATVSLAGYEGSLSLHAGVLTCIPRGSCSRTRPSWSATGPR